MGWFRVKGVREDGYGVVLGEGEMGMGWVRVTGRRIWIG